MEKRYRVKSSYYLSQAQTGFEYNWFVYRRRAEPDARRDETGGVARQLAQELFTFEEATRFQAVLATFFAVIGGPVQVTTTLEPAGPEDETGTLRETYKSGGHYVDPFEFAEVCGESLDFLVGARVTLQEQDAAASFLSKLAPERLAALRRMHCENNG